MDVAAWLQSLGLSRYEAAFGKNAIEVDVLPDLTDGDLAELGINLGDRKRLLKAIARLGSAEPPKRAAETPSSSKDDAERRPITVLFCDLVGSTTIAAKLDPEDWRSLVGSYLDAASAAVTRLGGRVQDTFGDGLMALFGHPQAQENDAERAVRAALAIQRSLDDLNAANANSDAPQLAARIGIESGRVVVDATGAVFGEAPNVAARVQALAEPGSVIVTAAVQRQIAGLFVAEDRGVRELKGAPAPVALYRIVRASGGGRRGGGRALTPLVGREEELERLGRRWERARSGEGQLVLVIGEPGIGKSRLVEEFHAQLGETPHTWVEWSSSQLLQNTPLHPIVEWGRLRFGGADAPAGQGLADLESTLRLSRPRRGRIRAHARALGRRSARRGAPAAIRAGRTEPPTARGDNGLGSRGRAVATGRAGFRGFALGRSDLARSHARTGRARRAGAAAGHRDHAPGVSRALDRERASQRHLSCLRSIADRSRAWSANSPRAMRCPRGR